MVSLEIIYDDETYASSYMLIEWDRFDVDMYDHLNNTVYPVLFDSIVNAYLIKHCGLDPFNKGDSKQIGVIVSAYCDYFASVSFPDLLDLGLRVVKLGSSSVTYEIGVFRRNDGDVKVVGGYTHVFVQRASMRPTKDGMDLGIRRGLEKLVILSGSPKL